MKKILFMAFILSAGIVVIFTTVLFAAMSLANSPGFAWRVLRYGESDTQDYEIFPERPIENGEAFSVIARGDPEKPEVIEYFYDGQSRAESLDDLLARTDTHAFLIVKNDELVYESYPGSSRSAINTSFSSAKSVVSALIGAAIADGYIGNVSDPVIRFIPEITGRGLDALTIRDLLLMNSGIRYVHDFELPFYRVPFGDDAFSYYSPDMRQIALNVEASGAPIGAAFRYNNYHLLLEGMILERATGMHVAEYLQERIWKPMGAEFPASWSLDSTRSGFEKMESGINARAVDYARFGLIFLHHGDWNGTQILPAAWVAESTAPLVPDPRAWENSPDWPDYGGYYKYHWWGIRNADGTHDFYAHGKYDQIVYVAPRANAVVVRLGASSGENVNWPLFMHALVDQMLNGTIR